MLDSGLVKDAQDYAELKVKVKRHEAEIAKLKELMKPLEERLIESFIANGVSSVKAVGGTVGIIEEVWPALIVPEGWTADEARAKAVAALEGMGHGRFITYNQQSMRALVREMKDDAGHLPPPLGEFVRAEIRHRIGVTNAKEK